MTIRGNLSTLQTLNGIDGAFETLIGKISDGSGGHVRPLLRPEQTGGFRVRIVTVFVHTLLWLSISSASILNAENTVPASNGGGSSGASCSLAVVSPNHQDLIRWIDLDEGGPFTYNEWKAGRDAPEPLQYEHVHSEYPLCSVQNSSRVAVMISADLWDTLQTTLELYSLDLAGEGFGVDIYTISDGI